MLNIFIKTFLVTTLVFSGLILFLLHSGKIPFDSTAKLFLITTPPAFLVLLGYLKREEFPSLRSFALLVVFFSSILLPLKVASDWVRFSQFGLGVNFLEAFVKLGIYFILLFSIILILKVVFGNKEKTKMEIINESHPFVELIFYVLFELLVFGLFLWLLW